jgi:Tfp pilus assembly protein PilX
LFNIAESMLKEAEMNVEKANASHTEAKEKLTKRVRPLAIVFSIICGVACIAASK